ncbi:MAG: hypothetical protein M3N07_00705 [Pseudomonadota bacterium]|nr:hypothetical protein [Pseudomonadota bacterium]
MLLATDTGRERFWAESSRSAGDGFTLTFAAGTEERCRLLEAEPPRRFAFTYFGSHVLIELAPDGSGGTDLTLANSEVPDEDYEEALPGWLNVLLPLKAAADFGVDLRNHDPARTWRERYVDQ